MVRTLCRYFKVPLVVVNYLLDTVIPLRFEMLLFFSIFVGEDEPDTIGPEGVEKLCKDLGVKPEDVRLLCFLQHLSKIVHFLLNIVALL